MRWIVAASAVLLAGCASSSTSGKPSDTPTPSAPPPPATTTPPVTTPPPVAATSGTQSTLMGVYTETQATAGREVYLGRCVSCHAGEHGSGVFRRKWAGKPVQSLWGIIRETMPDDDPGGLSNEAYSQIVAYLLKLNGLPAGTVSLPADSLALKNIRFDTLTKR